MESRYKDNIVRLESELKILIKSGARFGNIRLIIAFLAAALTILLIVFWFSAIYFFTLVLAIAGFVFLSVQHSKVAAQINYKNGLIDINDEHLKRINGEWKDFSDSGKEFADYNHSYSHDLDLFGKKSLFQFINVTKTPYGRKSLRDDLASPKYGLEQIKDRQEAIKELSREQNLSFDYQYLSKKVKYDNDLFKVVSYVSEKPEYIKSNALKRVMTFLPYIIFLLAVVFFSVDVFALRIAASVLVLFQAVLWLLFAQKSLNYLSSSEKLHYSLSDYSRLYKVLENHNFESSILKGVKSDLTSGDISAANATKKLGRILNRIEMRSSGILYLLLNLLFLWDIGCALSLSAWTKKYGKYLKPWFTRLGEFESLLSFSVLDGVLSNSCMPTIVQQKHSYCAKDLGHPLLDNDKRICNDFELADNIGVISGSNMSGKTTFLRTLGINLLLAKCGSFVCANSLTVSNMTLVTSMRISDDLTDGVSTFYAELKKIKNILETAKGGNDVLFLIDEIFRGTNSVDRTSGAKAVIKKLKEYNAYGLLTTHDLNLCENMKDVKINNYNFYEKYVGGKLEFNYKINEGIAKTTNGEYLMKLIGIM